MINYLAQVMRTNFLIALSLSKIRLATWHFVAHYYNNKKTSGKKTGRHGHEKPMRGSLYEFDVVAMLRADWATLADVGAAPTKSQARRQRSLKIFYPHT